MKYALIAIGIFFNPIMASAQNNNLFADAGISLARLKPGTSITYDYNVVRWLGLGAGIQDYDFHATRTNFQYVPALFGDIRFNICPRKRNQFFVFLDLGANLYKHNSDHWREGNTVYNVPHDDGVYSGFGFGYFRRIKKHGWGPYTSLKMISNNYTADAYYTPTGEQKTEGWSDATLVISVGFKF